MKLNNSATEVPVKFPNDLVIHNTYLIVTQSYRILYGRQLA